MFLADLHIHSKYSRATSKECIPEILELWARRKGLDIIGTGDFTHPAWREELKEKLVPSEEGLYTLRDEFLQQEDIANTHGNTKTRFLISGEISSIYKKNGKVRKIHNLILLPSLEAADALSHRLEAIGNLHSDGRPILGLDSRDLLEITLDVCSDAIFIPAHIWTPHFSLFGAYSGFDTIEECFGDLTGYIHALETGLSSDPPMNWRLSALDRFTLVSNSDAHSPAKLAREANLFNTDLSYSSISKALENKGTKEFYGTVEFFPQEGKYHYDGHRKCKVCLNPSDTVAASGICPICGRKITVGVLHRVEELADREDGFIPPEAKHFESLVPLSEVIGSSFGVSAQSVKVKNRYGSLIRSLGSELFVLREAQLSDIKQEAGPLIAEGIRRLRTGKVEVLPGYDGEYGKVKIFTEDEIEQLSGQLYFFKKEDEGKGNQKKNKPSLPVVNRIKKKEEKIAVTSDAFSGLNDKQRQAVTSAASAISVIAGPGTGKTRTLVSRIAYLIQKCGITPDQITAVTFTNRAANEMRTRLASYFEDNHILKNIKMGTFHSICMQILSEKSKKSNLTVIQEQDALLIIEDILKEHEIKASARDILRRISLIKSGVQLAKDDFPTEIYELYCAALSRYGVQDYDDILLNVLKLFEEGNLDKRREKKLKKSFSYILVDEFQDINPIQYRLIQKWGKNNAGIFVIGDPDQAIYGFRGSDSHCFYRFSKDYPDVQEIRLVQNYRSTPEIIGCAQSGLAGKNTLEQALKAEKSCGSKVHLLKSNSNLQECIFIAKEINRLVGGVDMLDAHALNSKRSSSAHERSFSEIAVLYRTNRQAELLEQCLLKEGIPYLIAGQNEILKDREVRKAIAFFRFLLDPADLISLRLCLKEWAVCPDEKLSITLEDYEHSNQNITSFLSIAENFPSDNSGKFIELIHKYTSIVHRGKPQKIIETWICDNSLENSKNMELFLNMSVLHKKMPSLLNTLLFGRDGDLVRYGGKNYTSDAVSLMTLHAAKGLEFPIVFISGVKDGVIPLKNRNGDCDFDEERRLFYVGMTRAQDELTLLTSSMPSPFLSDISTDFLLKETALERKKIPKFEQVSFF